MAKEDDALAALHAHFASSFDSAPIKPINSTPKVNKSKTDKKAEVEKVVKAKTKDDLLERELGFDGSHLNKGKAKAENELKPVKASKTKPQSTRPPPETVVFGESSSGTSIPNQGGWRKFMSSKVETRKDKLEEEANKAAAEKQKKKNKSSSGDGAGDEEDAEKEKEMMTNDRALSDLLSTTLFAPQSEGIKKANGKPNLSSNSTLSRLMELSKPTLTDQAKSVGRGLGSSMFKAKEMGKMPASMRHGLRKAELQKQADQLEKAKELGIYHQSIKGLIGKGADGSDLVLGTKKKDHKARTRDKGLSMGVGRFAGGTLKLSKEEVARINKPTSSGRGAGGKRKRS
ncbi:uncharacterized protein FA14DRAFT_10300 [Meira miltonrushii]|uniref:Uncharacterized protein n=1 Tax=Meira miltonrushii TaxID=1280837 RepID=A0A316VJ88_9BASI|nr:uncharacterized protein FA14DRAFT_10300 [Meira miltonrushii]PWN37128.1 hypothetical protein FA14DRAFT_10300 [Meira miltonrushii]